MRRTKWSFSLLQDNDDVPGTSHNLINDNPATWISQITKGSSDTDTDTLQVSIDRSIYIILSQIILRQLVDLQTNLHYCEEAYTRALDVAEYICESEYEQRLDVEVGKANLPVFVELDALKNAGKAPIEYMDVLEAVREKLGLSEKGFWAALEGSNTDDEYWKDEDYGNDENSNMDT